MNKKLSLALLSLAIALLVVAPLRLARAAEMKFEIDSAHSNVGFAVPILGGLSKVRGKFSDFTVQISYDDADVSKSSVVARIKATSVDTGIERRDAHLRNADFFDVEKFPEIVFESKRVEKKGNQLIAHGTFTMHGVSKEIELPFTVSGLKKNPTNGSTTMGVTARLTLDRRDYGITYARGDNPDFLGNMIDIELDLVTRPSGGQPPPQQQPRPPQPSATPAKP